MVKVKWTHQSKTLVWIRCDCQYTHFSSVQTNKYHVIERETEQSDCLWHAQKFLIQLSSQTQKTNFKTTQTTGVSGHAITDIQ